MGKNRSRRENRSGKGNKVVHESNERATKHSQFRRNPRCDWCGTEPSIALLLCVVHPVIGLSAISVGQDCKKRYFYADDDGKWKLKWKF